MKLVNDVNDEMKIATHEPTDSVDKIEFKTIWIR